MSQDPHGTGGIRPLPGLPPELAELDAELLAFRAEERCSFGPELKAELQRRWLHAAYLSRPTPGGARARARAAAAVLGALLIGGLVVPPVRASLAELSRESFRLLMGGAPASLPPADERPAPAAAPLGLVLPQPTPPDHPETRDHARAAEPWSRESPDHGIGIGVPPAFRQPAVTLPRLLDGTADARAIGKYYPQALQRAGIGGTATVRLWVDSTGTVEDVRVARGAGRPELDRAALLAAKELRWAPATRDLVPVGTWVEFQLVFDPGIGPPGPPEPPRVDEPALLADLTSELPPAWSGEAISLSPIGVEARELLRAALKWSPTLDERLGSLESLLEGAPGPDRSPLTWRADATRVLQAAMARDPENPAPYLALGRIRLKQGLYGEARGLLEKGIQGARRGVWAASPELVAELHYELGLLLRNEAAAWRDLGTLEAEAFPADRCPGDGTSASAVEEPSDVLVGWNYVCPEALEGAFTRGFRAVRPSSDIARAASDAFHAAVEANPGHRGANLALLLELADDERWYELLNAARAFGYVSDGHPYGLLMEGLALHRIGWPEQALEVFEKALRRLPGAEVARLRDPAPLMSPEEAGLLGSAGEDAEAALSAFWASVDPVLSTPVNEREVEHLARAAYATLRFGDLHGDAAVVWLRYGRPLHVRTLGSGTALRTEFWDYGRGPDLTFRRPAISAEPHLTPEARSYLEDLRHVFPQWYGIRARSVSVLPAQVARFRGVEPGEVELQVHARVPEAFATGGADSLDMAVVVQGSRGALVSRSDVRIPARTAIVRLPSIRAPSGAERVVVELFHPRLGQAVGLRAPVQRDGDAPEPPHVSDLLLTEPPSGPGGPAPADSPAPGSPRVGDEVTGDRLGVEFELYDLSPDLPYHMRMEVAGRGSLPLLVRPADASGFLREWSRPAAAGDRVREHVTVDLSGVPPGTHQLRLEVRAGDGATWTATRRIERR